MVSLWFDPVDHQIWLRTEPSLACLPLAYRCLSVEKSMVSPSGGYLQCAIGGTLVMDVVMWKQLGN